MEKGAQIISEIKIYCDHCYYYAPYLNDWEACMTERIHYEKGIESPGWKFQNAKEKNKNNDCSDFRQATWWSKFRNKSWSYSGLV